MPTFSLYPAMRGLCSFVGSSRVRLSAERRLLLVVSAVVALALAVAMVTLICGHADLLGQMEVFKGAKEIKGVTEFLEDIKGYLLSIALAGFTIAAIAAGTAKFVGHTKANDLVFNIGVGVAIFAAIPTLVA